MRKSMLVLLGAALFLSPMAVSAAPDVTPGKQDSKSVPRSGPPAKALADVNGNYAGRSRGNGKIGFLSPQQQAMLSREPGGQAELRKLGTLSQNDRLKMQTRLQKAWDNLPQAEKDKMQRQIADTMSQQQSGPR